MFIRIVSVSRILLFHGVCRIRIQDEIMLLKIDRASVSRRREFLNPTFIDLDRVGGLKLGVMSSM